MNSVKRNHGLGVFYWGPEGVNGDGTWQADGSAAPSIYVMERMKELTVHPPSSLR